MINKKVKLLFISDFFVVLVLVFDVVSLLVISGVVESDMFIVGLFGIDYVIIILGIFICNILVVKVF